MLRPVIFIGCGGSGEKAVRYVRAAVQRTLDHYDWPHGMPNPWQFIGLDTLTVQESPTEIPTIPSQDFLTLSSEHDTYAALHRSLEANHNQHQGHPELLCGWLPNPDGVSLPLKDGAGQNRAIGRAAGLRSLERTLLSRLKEAFRRASSGGQELYEVGQALGVDAELGTETPAPLVMVCSSMAGGTGAGVALDVIDLVRRCDPLGAHPSLVLFANDIFDVGEKVPMAANSLGLISELMAAYWSRAGEIESPLTTKGVQSPGAGPHSVFVLGKVGYSGADLGNTKDFYHAVGEALSVWVTSAVVQEQIHNFINVNWRNNAKINFGGYPFGKDAQFGAISSFGAAKVTVGRDRFVQWAQHKIGREVLDALLKGHLRDQSLQGNQQTSQTTDAELIAELGKKYAPMVFAGAPLWEAAPEQLEGFQGAQLRFASDEKVRNKARELNNDLTETLGGHTSSGAQWASELELLARQQVSAIDRSSTAPEDHQWHQDMVDATCLSASQVAAVSSLGVASAALREAVKLNQRELNDVRRAAQLAEHRYGERVGQGLEQIRNINGQADNNHGELVDGIKSVAQGVAFRWQFQRLNHVAKVLEHAEREVFGVIAGALDRVVPQVGEALDSDEVNAWPMPHTLGVPDRYTPSTVEFPLEHHDQWMDNLELLCQEARESRVPYGAREIDALRYRLIAGTPIASSKGQIPSLVHRSPTRWILGQSTRVICQAGKADIEARVHQWTNAPGSKFKRFLDEGLAAYLNESDPDSGEPRLDHTQRLQEFRRQLGKAKEGSKPLVSVDQDLYGVCHPTKSLELRTICSQFPFPEGHAASEDAKGIVGEAAYSISSTDTTSILVSQYLGNPVHPMVVRSITEPLNEAIAVTEDPVERSSSFWMWRRARRLDGFIPLPRTVLEAVVRGFAVARLCGYITADASKPMCISAAPDEVEFPFPCLSRLRHPNDVLAGLLESFSLTYGLVGGEGIAAFEGYRRLHGLGEPIERKQLPRDLENLLNTGLPTYAAVAGEEAKVIGSTLDERQSRAMSYLEANVQWFWDKKTNRGERIHHRNQNGLAEEGVPTMEMADVFARCYSQLLELLAARGSKGSVV